MQQQQLTLRPGTRPRRPYQAPRLIRHEENEVTENPSSRLELEEFLRQFRMPSPRP